MVAEINVEKEFLRNHEMPSDRVNCRVQSAAHSLFEFLWQPAAYGLVPHGLSAPVIAPFQGLDSNFSNGSGDRTLCERVDLKPTDAIENGEQAGVHLRSQ